MSDDFVLGNIPIDGSTVGDNDFDPNEFESDDILDDDVVSDLVATDDTPLGDDDDDDMPVEDE